MTLWWNIPSLCLVHFPLVPWWWYNKLTKHKVKKFKIFHCQKIQFPPRTKKSTINKHEFNTFYNNIHFSSHNKISCDSFFDCLTNLICFFHRKFYRENSENSQVIVQKHAAKFVHYVTRLRHWMCALNSLFSRFLCYITCSQFHNVLRLSDIFTKFSFHHKWNNLAINKHGIYELPYELPNNLRLRILGN